MIATAVGVPKVSDNFYARLDLRRPLLNEF